DCGISLNRRKDRRHEILPRTGARFDFGNSLRGGCGVATCPQREEAPDLLLLDGRVDAQNGNRLLTLGAVTVHAYDDTFVAFDALLIFVGRLLDLPLHIPRFYSAQHTA